MSALVMFVVYDRPLDYPLDVVVRRWTLERGEMTPEARPYIIAKSVDDARAKLPPGLTNIGRYEQDEPQIVEVWV